jgi:hypothetical protein
MFGYENDIADVEKKVFIHFDNFSTPQILCRDNIKPIPRVEEEVRYMASSYVVTNVVHEVGVYHSYSSSGMKSSPIDFSVPHIYAKVKV